MRKIPVFETLGHSYAFAFRKYFPLLGVIWLPAAILFALGYVVLWPVAGIMFAAVADAVKHPGTTGVDPQALAAMTRMQGYIWLFDLVEFALFPIILVGITKEALGLRQGFRPVYLAFGLEEVLVLALFFAALAAVFVMAIAFALVAVIVGVIVAILSSSMSAPPAPVQAALGAAGAIAVVLAVVAMLYAILRATYLYVPIAVAERQFGVARSWELMKGNVLRAVALLLLTVIPFVLAEWIVVAIVAVPALVHFASLAQKHDVAAIEAQFSAFAASLPYYLAVLGSVGTLIAPVLLGLLYGPAAFAYRSLVPEQENSPSAAL